MIPADLVYLIIGVALALAVVLPGALRTRPLSAPMVLVGFGALLGLLPFTDPLAIEPELTRTVVEHVTELTVLVSLMGVGLALDRPLSLRDLSTWRGWTPTWRMLGIAMPLCIGAVALLGWGLGLAPAVALLVGAVLAPTDPVLASDVQVEGPNAGGRGGGPVHDEEHEVRFTLTSEAGLNDGLSFPFVYAAIFLVGAPFADWGVTWVAWDLVGKIVVGVAVGVVLGWVLGILAFRARRQALRVAETGETLMALAAVLLAYGAAEVAGGYGFLAVFACALTFRSRERADEYHHDMHEMVENLERILTLVLLLGLGFALTRGVLAAADWRSVVVTAALLLFIRPASGWLALRGECGLNASDRLVVGFFGVRGIGSLYYTAYALGHADFGDDAWVWATVSLVIVTSVVVHGVSATPAMAWLDRRNAHRQRAAQ